MTYQIIGNPHKFAMLTIGLAGSMCTGKSFVLNILADLGCYVAQADLIARKLMFSPGSPLHPELLKLFGDEISGPEGRMDIDKLRQLIFNEEDKRDKVIARIVPLEKDERQKLICQVSKMNDYPFFIYESAYLIEMGTYHDFDRVIVTYTLKAEYLERLFKYRQMMRSDAEAFFNRQLALQEKLKIAHYSIDTSGSMAQTKSNTLNVFNQLECECKNV